MMGCYDFPDSELRHKEKTYINLEASFKANKTVCQHCICVWRKNLFYFSCIYYLVKEIKSQNLN